MLSVFGVTFLEDDVFKAFAHCLCVCPNFVPCNSGLISMSCLEFFLDVDFEQVKIFLFHRIWEWKNSFRVKRCIVRGSWTHFMKGAVAIGGGYFSWKGVFKRVFSGFVKQKGAPGTLHHPASLGLESALQMPIGCLLHLTSTFVVRRL